MLSVQDPVRFLKGVGPAKEALLDKLGIRTVRDLLYHFPRAYQHRAQIKLLKDGMDGNAAAFLLTVQTQPRQVKTRGGLMLLTFLASDTSGSVEVVYFNKQFIHASFEIGQAYRFWGALHQKGGRLQMSSPDYEIVRDDIPLPAFVPVYPSTQSLSQKQIQKLVDTAIEQALPTLEDILPEEIRSKERLPTLKYAIRGMHRPNTESELHLSLRRLMFDELFCLGVGIGLSKQAHSARRTAAYPPVSPEPILKMLPYELTGAQKRAINDIYRDMTKKDGDGTCPTMRRILIGDVGSGKTICAAFAAFLTVSAGRQCALMAPTEILATQHYKDMSGLFEALGYKVCLLTGSTPAKEKKQIYEGLAGRGENRIDFVIGTHALLSDKVSFAALGLTITDEQHRFGVMQRATLKEKSESSHLLVMSATPIPRSLALAMYGDLSVSRIDEMPPGRQEIKTYVVNGSYRERLYGFIQKQVEAGGQVYIVCPAIETDKEDPEQIGAVELRSLFSKHKSAALPLKAASDLAEHLATKVFPNLRVALLHGQMKNTKKDEVMAEFAKGNIDILVSTTVIEVGVNVPAATLMVVENAERFGLSQLHQLRGRVGRGNRQSYCILVSDSEGEAALSRLAVMQSCHDGYEIAEKDLLLRGPGDFFANIADAGVRQSGGLSLRLAQLCEESDLLRHAFESAAALVAKDPELRMGEHRSLAAHVEAMFTFRDATIS